jgi:hypothetical protein
VIYFVGQIIDPGSVYFNSLWIYGILDDGSGGESPTFSAAMYNAQPLSEQTQSSPPGNIAVSPDGSTIAYFALYRGLASICYYHNIDGVNYSFNHVTYVIPSHYPAVEESMPHFDPKLFNSLQFIYNATSGLYDLYFVAPGFDWNVYRLVFEEAFCENVIANKYRFIT